MTVQAALVFDSVSSSQSFARSDTAFHAYARPSITQKTITFIDLFAGLGGTRIGFELACQQLNLKPSCVFTSEIKDYAIDAYQQNFDDSLVHGDITEIIPKNIPNFDYLLAGFPCQPFSSAGKRKGFLDARGGLFFTIIEILKTKRPTGFLLENVEGLASHNNGNTLNTILVTLRELGYQVSWQLLDASDFGVPQKRKRIYIVGHLKKTISLHHFVNKKASVKDVIEAGIDFKPTPFAGLLAKQFTPEQLNGKAIKDKRGGTNNIHSWDLELKGALAKEQKALMCEILKKRRYKIWAVQKGITWMDGMPLTYDEIVTFYQHDNLQAMLDDLTNKGYLTFEHPRELVTKDGATHREPALHVAKGYNIVAGKLSFPISKILDPNHVAPTLVATEAGKLAISTEKGVRKITVREGLRLSGFPDSYKLEGIAYAKAFDLIGNTVMPPVIKEVSLRLLA
jgi:DNA (cytosine-5)-methyltransferase 1